MISITREEQVLLPCLVSTKVIISPQVGPKIKYKKSESITAQ